jgi:hypothetical protein
MEKNFHFPGPLSGSYLGGATTDFAARFARQDLRAAA